jgi:TolB-like protein/Tfp pilus assembly protein PilF
MPPVRRLAAILAADVAGYSRLMGADEEGTHERLRGHLRDLIEPKIAEHRGRVVKNTGDGFLAEFQSVVDAVRCAVEMQRGMTERNEGTQPEERIEFRVGINLGDVIAEAEDIFGDGVNVAARLEALAEPGGIYVSRVVRDQVRDKVDHTFRDLGEQQVKNITRPVRVYAWRPEGQASMPTASVKSSSPTLPAVAAPRLSIVVLPFSNLGNDPDQQYFADGITEDLTAELSRLAAMSVISCNTAFTYQSKRVDTKRIGSELGVRYVLEGSVRRSGNQVRVNVQLINAETDVHRWAERFDGDTSDLFALQDEITGRIAIALNLELVAVEAARPTDRPDALDFILRGRAALLKPVTHDTRAEAITLFEHALALDPRSVEAQAWLAAALAGRVIRGVTVSAAADIQRATELSEQALAAAPRSPHAHGAKAQVLRAQHRYAEAIPEYETLLKYHRNSVHSLLGLAQCKLYTGSIEETIPLVEQAIRLSPRDPRIEAFYWQIGFVHLLQSQTDDAIIWFEKAKRASPAWTGVRLSLASAYALKDNGEHAAAELAEARRLAGEGIRLSIARQRARASSGVPKIRALIEATYFAGLRKAGMPEE